MTELAIKGLPQFAISFADAPDPSGSPNYTIDTLLRLRKQFPSARLYTLMGADSLLEPSALVSRRGGSFSGALDCRLAAGPAALKI